MQDQPINANLAADVVRVYELGDVREYGIDANVCIYGGSPVIVDAITPGLANVPETAGGAGTFVGFSQRRCDNRVGAARFIGDGPGSGLAGAFRVRVNARGYIVLWVGGLPTLVGAAVYAHGSNDFNVVKPGAGADYLVGRIVEFTTDLVQNGLTRCVVQFDAFAMDALGIGTGAGEGAEPTQYIANGAITQKEGTALLTKPSAGAYTLALPIAGTDDGKILRIVAGTPFAHTVTTPATGYDGTQHIATFGGHAGDAMELLASGGTWEVVNNTNVVIS